MQAPAAHTSFTAKRDGQDSLKWLIRMDIMVVKI